jgi:hypothetical protein
MTQQLRNTETGGNRGSKEELCNKDLFDWPGAVYNLRVADYHTL